MNTDSIVEVRAFFYAKGDKVHVSEIEELVSGTGPTWEEATDVIPEEQRDPPFNGIGQPIPDEERPDSVFNQDWIGLSFVAIADRGDGHCSGLEWMAEEAGEEDVFGPFRDELRKMAEEECIGKENRVVRLVTAWSYWTKGQPLPDDDFDCGVELQGRLDMCNLALRK